MLFYYISYLGMNLSIRRDYTLHFSPHGTHQAVIYLFYIAISISKKAIISFYIYLSIHYFNNHLLSAQYHLLAMYLI